MRVIDTETEALDTNSVVCLGYFDGVHLGHRALLSAAADIGAKNGWLVCVHALDRSPMQVLHPEQSILQLTTPEEKARLFEAAGADVLAVTPFNDRVRHMPGKVFFEEILRRRLQAKAIVVGDDHRFGYRGDTDVTKLRALCDASGVSLTVVPRISLPDGTVISSSAIRAALAEGRLDQAQAMLGRAPDQEMLRRCTGSNKESRL